MNLPEIDKQIEQSEALDQLFRRMDAKGWPTSKQNHELCMERAREFLDAVKAIYPNA